MDLLKTLRERTRKTRSDLSARSRISDKVEGLDAGQRLSGQALHLEELEARVRSLTRRSFVQHDAVRAAESCL